MPFDAFTVLSLLAGLFWAIFWMIVGWRAMRAHEKIAAVFAQEPEAARRLVEAAHTDRQQEKCDYAEFLESEPLANHLTAEERSHRYTEWKRRKDDGEKSA